MGDRLGIPSVVGYSIASFFSVILIVKIERRGVVYCLVLLHLNLEINFALLFSTIIKEFVLFKKSTRQN